MAARRFYSNNAPQLTTSGSITAGATTVGVAGSFSGWPVQFPFYAALDIGTASFEIVSVTNIVGTTATIVRAQDGTAAISHPAGATLDQVVVRQDLDEANAHVVASTGVHGISGSVVGTSDNQNLTNKTVTSPVLAGTATGSGAINTSGAITTTAGITGGSVTTGGAVAATGAVSGSAFTAAGNGAVTGVVVPKTYTTEAAATAALGSPVTGTQVWLTAPTGTGYTAGLFSYTGSAWVPTLGFAGRLQYHQTTTQALTNGSNTVLTGFTLDKDTLGGFNTATGIWTVPAGAGGDYECSITVSNNNGAVTLFNAVIQLNGTTFHARRDAPSSAFTTQVLPPVEKTLVAGDAIQFAVFASGTGASTVSSGSFPTIIRIKRVL